jgi:hypothetical protein
MRNIVSLANVLALSWIVVLYWGERQVFHNSIRRCAWDSWEDWVRTSDGDSPTANSMKPSDASPHRVALVADPQLVDPHTYPGRPWPLSSLTVQYTDRYIARAFRLLQNGLYPDSTIFLGDLFDGGREWSTLDSVSPEERWRKYGEMFWLKEYRRFTRMFFDPWLRAGVVSSSSPSSRRQILTHLPGNHDLGFAGGVQLPVRNRFTAFFGEGNRVDILGNHTFISVDSVSLSARGVEGGSESIWQPAQSFLDDFPSIMNRAFSNHEQQRGHANNRDRHQRTVIEGDDLQTAAFPDPPQRPAHSYPSILLTHVPLYRDSGTPCGPLRERWPPSFSADGEPLAVDERNAIRVSAGYQYQNVLTPEISKDITSKLENLSYAFSGDDHDYCDVVHRRYPSGGGGIREITVKSISWAMGVRKPGFQLLSLWNPNDGGETQAATLKTRLCLLPDQIGIFINYALMLAATVALLVARAAYLAFHPSRSALSEDAVPLLPTSRDLRSETERCESASSEESCSAAYSWPGRDGLSARTVASRLRGSSPSPSRYGLPRFGNSDDVLDSGTAFGARERRLGFIMPLPRWMPSGSSLFGAELKRSMFRVAVLALPWYLWLIWAG